MTSLEVRGERARFVIATDAGAQDDLAHMGYLPLAEGLSATRWFPRSAQPERYLERFAASIETMVLQHRRALPIPWDEALLEFLTRVEGSQLRWWLYGSAALAVRGLAVEPGDVDLHVDDAPLAGRLLDDLLVTPVERLDGWVAGYAGRTFCGAVLEWLADPHADLDDPAAPLEQGPFIEPHLERVRWRGHVLRVPPLEAQLRVSEARGLTDRAALIGSALRSP